MPISTRMYAAAAGAVTAAALLGFAIIPAFRPDRDIFADCRETAVSGGNGAIGGPFCTWHLRQQSLVDVGQLDVIVALQAGPVHHAPLQ